MIFNTYWFIVFSATFFPVYWILTNRTWRFCWLLAASAVFHTHFAGPSGVVPIIVLGSLTFLAGLSRRRWACIATIVLCVAALCFYKYTHFITQEIVAWVNLDWSRQAQVTADRWLPLAPPLAISFFVFEFVHYLVEVIRGHEPMRRPGEFVSFAIFFPSLVAGPIKRYENFRTELHRGLQQTDFSDISTGATRIAIGLLKKVVADNFTLVITFYQGDFTTLPAPGAWALFGALAFRILLDFSGYTDIAIGLARLMGIGLPENFNYPYLARSLQEFWQRWHISLSTWIRDYVYIPLGGNRLGLARRVLNGLCAFALCGLWHGASWNFVIWGLWHGIGLAINATYAKGLGVAGHKLQRFFVLAPVAGWLLTQAFVWFGWLLFFFDVHTAWRFAVKLLSFR